MGLAKTAWIEAQERGWSAPNTSVCPDCVDDSYLKELLATNASQFYCDYCETEADEPFAAEFEVLAEAVWNTAWSYYCDPAQEVPYDRGYVVPTAYFPEVLDDLGFSGNDRVREDLENTDVNAGVFTKAVNGDWMGVPADRVAKSAWNTFAETVKHRTRFHFYRPDPTDEYGTPYDVGVSETLPVVARQLRIVTRTIPAGTVVYRVREKKAKDDWHPDAEQMGAPPDHVARAGRMNPAGIAYLYASLDPLTAVTEVNASRRGGTTPFLAEFRLTKDVTVFDLTAVPPEPSIFDIANKDLRQARSFIEAFSDSISKPVRKDGSEHIGYVPSQVVCEYLAQAFELEPGIALGGLLYKSAANPDGKNLVLFPQHDWHSRNFQGVEFVSVAPYGPVIRRRKPSSIDFFL